MKLNMLGIDFSHAKGEFCLKRTDAPFYMVCRFATPFLYWKDGTLASGEKGAFLINPPQSVIYHGPRAEAESGFVNDWMYIEGTDFGTLLQKYPLPLNRAFQVEQNGLFRRYADRLQTEFRLQKAGAHDMINSLITEMIIELHRAFTQPDCKKEPHAAVIAVKNAVIQHPEKRWTLAGMAGASGYSVSRFCELYTMLYGMPPMTDVLNERVRLAKQMLRSGQSSVSYVAHACGFGTINYFSKYFKKTVGCTPTAYMLAARETP